jgi:hypothetical protein
VQGTAIDMQDRINRAYDHIFHSKFGRSVLVRRFVTTNRGQWCPERQQGCHFHPKVSGKKEVMTEAIACKNERVEQERLDKKLCKPEPQQLTSTSR